MYIHRYIPSVSDLKSRADAAYALSFRLHLAAASVTPHICFVNLLCEAENSAGDKYVCHNDIGVTKKGTT